MKKYVLIIYLKTKEKVRNLIQINKVWILNVK